MQVEDNTEGQQPNPGQGDAATAAANPQAEQGTDPAKAQGQGNGGDNAGGDAGKQGDAAGAGGEGGAGDGQDKTGDESAATGAPESYTDFTLPDGYALEGPRLEVAHEKFKELKLSQAQAQGLVDLYCQFDGENQAVLKQAVEDAVAAKREGWGAQAREELGDKYDAEVAFAKTAVQATENPKLLQSFNEEGWGNHPELIKAFAFFGKMMRDSPIDGIGSASGGADEKKQPWERMYPDMNK